MSDIDCIIVGKDCAGSLRACVDSVRAASYTRGEVHLYYFDEGSADDSVALARQLGVEVAEDRQAGSSPLIQYLSAGRTLAPDWFAVATKGQRDNVRGRIEQPDPHADWLKWVVYLESNPPAGDIAEMDDGLYLRERGGKMEMVAAPMAFQDIHLKGWAHWWRWVNRLKKDRNEVLLRGWGTIGLIILTIFGMAWAFWWIALLLPAAILLLYPRIFDVDKIATAYGITPNEAVTFAWHRSLKVIPQCLGRKK